MPFSKKPVAAATFGTDAKRIASAGSRPASRCSRPASRGHVGKVTEKPLGELEGLTPARAYASNHSAPARLNLSNALADGLIRNPLEMLHKTQKYALMSSRPPSATFDARPRPTSQMGSERAKKLQSFPTLLPQRVELPAYLNTPSRRSLDEPNPVTPDERLVIAKKVRDLEILAEACRRANKVREEGRTFFSLGVLEDNMGNYQKALRHYTAFLKVCKECKDAQGCSLAYHCLGVGHQLLGTGDSEKPQCMRRALYFHSKHRDAADSAGKFIAHLNMGICYAHLQEKESSTVNHQYALRYSLELNSTEKQALALGNLGFSTGMYDDDVEKQRTLVQKYISLSQEKHAAPLEKLGTLAARTGDFEAGKEYFQEALTVARNTRDKERERHARVYLGIATGEIKFAEHINSILGKKVGMPLSQQRTDECGLLDSEDKELENNENNEVL